MFFQYLSGDMEDTAGLSVCHDEGRWGYAFFLKVSLFVIFFLKNVCISVSPFNHFVYNRNQRLP